MSGPVDSTSSDGEGEAEADTTRAEDSEATHPHERPALTLAPGDAIGRFRIERLLGAGGMGRVYAAHDPELDRTVAVKLLRDDGWTSRDHARFLREARAMGRLRHPNVVTVHEVGEAEGRPYIAMELLEGSTLAAWVRAEPRSWREIRDAFVAAGRGLAAAHAAGLVHRDFKPSNVVCGPAGVRVVDFGLALRAGDEDDSAPGSPGLEVDLTRTGALVGTLVYMAPEQLGAGGRATARSDQWSFCVALHEILYRKLPFAGRRAEELLAAVEAGVDPAPGPPRFLTRLLRRGLALDPARRYPSMAALLEDLDRDPGRRARRVGLGAGALAAAAAALVVSWPRAAAPCRDAGRPFDDAWLTTLRPRLVAHFAASKVPAAQGVGDKLVVMLDDYLARLGAARAGVCEATFVRHAQSEHAFDAQVECLRRTEHRFDLIVGQLSELSGTTIVATRVADRLDDPAGCRSVTAPGHGPPADPARREALLRALDAAHAELALSHLKAADEAYAAAIEEAKAVGEAGLIAEGLLSRGQALLHLGKDDDARRLIDEGTATALAGQETQQALRGYVLTVNVSVNNGKQSAEAERAAGLFRWLADRTGQGAELEPRLLSELGGIYARDHRAAEAEAMFRKGLALPGLKVGFRAELRHRLAILLLDADRRDEARPLLVLALADAVQAYGAESAVAIEIETSQVYMAFASGGAAEAVPLQEKLVERIERFGSERPRLVVDGLHNLVAYLLAANQDQRGLDVARRAYDLAEAQLTIDDRSRLGAATTLAGCLLDFDRIDEALPILEKVREQLDPAGAPPGEPRPVSAAMLHMAFARSYRERGPKLALEHLARARQIVAPVHERADIKRIVAEMDELEAKITARGPAKPPASRAAHP